MASAITKITEAPSSTTIATREQRKSAIAAMEEPLPDEGPLTPGGEGDIKPVWGMPSPRGGKRRKRKTKRRKRKSRKKRRRKKTKKRRRKKRTKRRK